jgi:hypothetical protein
MAAGGPARADAPDNRHDAAAAADARVNADVTASSTGNAERRRPDVVSSDRHTFAAMLEAYDVPALDATPEEVRSWFERQVARGRPRVDVNDQLLVYNVARVLADRHPAVRARLEQHVGPAMHTADGVGMLAASHDLARRTGFPVDEVERTLRSVWQLSLRR